MQRKKRGRLILSPFFLDKPPHAVYNIGVTAFCDLGNTEQRDKFLFRCDRRKAESVAPCKLCECRHCLPVAVAPP